MFTIADIRDIAIQIEINGEKAYRKASREATDPEVAEIFNWMADEEKRHGQWFKSINADKPLTEEQKAIEEMGRQLLKEMIAGQTFSMEEDHLKNIKTFQDMVVQSKSFEKTSKATLNGVGTDVDDSSRALSLDSLAVFPILIRSGID